MSPSGWDLVILVMLFGFAIREVWWGRRLKEAVVDANTQRVLAGQRPYRNEPPPPLAERTKFRIGLGLLTVCGLCGLSAMLVGGAPIYVVLGAAAVTTGLAGLITVMVNS